MALVPFNPQYRRSWMFPRNIRRIEPWKMDQIINVLLACQGDTTSQEVQDFLYDELENLGIKRPKNEGGVRNQGGMRTYFAQLASLGLVWQDDNKVYHATRAGEALKNHQEPLKVIRTQLLRLQFPSAYGKGQNIKIHPDIRVKPFVFLLRLMDDSRLKYLTDEEIAIPVLYGHNDNCFEECVERILEMRQAEGRLDAVVNDEKALYTIKAKNRSLEKGIKDVKDIANTAKNYLLAAQLIESDGNKKWQMISDSETRQWINQLMNEPLIKIDNFTEASFQKHFGRYNQEKDTRQKTKKSGKEDGFTILVQTRYTASVAKSLFEFDHLDFAKQLSKDYGRSESEILNIIEPIRDKQKSIEHDTYMQYALSGGEYALEMEKATTAIFRRLGFNKSEHIGQRKTKINRSGGFPDIYILAEGMDCCGMADTKATSRYTFPLTDTQKLETYYHDCWQEIDDSKPMKFFIYIAGGFRRSDVDKSLLLCKQKLNVPVSAITTRVLLDLLSREKTPSVKNLIKIFQKGKYYVAIEQFNEL